MKKPPVLTPEKALEIFRAWRGPDVVRRFKEVSVPCGECSHCCMNVRVYLIEADLLSGFPYRMEEGPKPYSDNGPIILSRTEDGSCIYYVDGKCSIRDNRPSICRAFDCRNSFWQMEPRALGEVYFQDKIETELVETAK